MAGTAVHFTTRDASRITGLSSARIRYCARVGLIDRSSASGAAQFYSFNDLVVLKTTKRLLDAGISLRKIRRAYASLPRRSDALQQVTRWAVGTDGHHVVVGRQGTCWHAESGQMVLPFAAPPRARRRISPLPRRKPHLNADQWYDLGIDLETSSLNGAIEAYRRAIEQDPEMVEAHINVGRLLHVSGKLDLARAHYTRAMQLDPLDAIPVFNLGVVLEDIGDTETALAMYKHAVHRDPLLADAHYNLALLYERRGCRAEALEHFRTYKKLTDSRSGGAG